MSEPRADNEPRLERAAPRTGGVLRTRRADEDITEAVGWPTCNLAVEDATKSSGRCAPVSKAGTLTRPERRREKVGTGPVEEAKVDTWSN